MPGRLLGGRYQVQDRIGTGGMATVYRGRDEVLGRTVAIKTMLPQYAGDPSFAARFKQEAQAAAALQSPYIVSVYDWGKDADTYYIVMEYLRGTDLKSGIKKHGALDCKKVAQIGSQIAQALSVAHKHEIIHRDIKPQNIMVQPDGNIKVMDFGIARAKNSHLTQDNSVLGTAHYVSPEQTQGKELGPTTDIYSLGIVMYESATGQVPFKGDDAISVALKQVNELPKPPSQLNPNVDPSLEAIILKCMQKDPAARFQTADELNHALRDYLAGRLSAVAGATATSVLPANVTSRIDATQGMTAVSPRINRENRYRPQSATEEAAEQEEARDRKRKHRLVAGAVAGVLVLIAAVAAIVNMLGSGSTTYAVPNLSGLTQEQAVQAIEADGHFEVGKITPTYDSKVEEGYVVDQSPNADRQVTEGSKIDFSVSKGPAPAASVTVPDLTDKSPEDAEALLASVQLVGKVGESEYSDTVAAGNVCRQDKAANSSAKAGDTVTYYLSKGPEQVSIPNVVGDSQDDATTQLEDAGFKVEVVEKSSDGVASGRVISSSPSGGSTAAKGTTVTITVSTGSSKIDVPSVIGWSYSDAKSTLEAAGFKVVLASGSSASGTVSYQSAAGTAAKGTTITLATKSTSTSTGGNTGGNSSGGTSSGDSGSGSTTGDDAETGGNGTASE